MCLFVLLLSPFVCETADRASVVFSAVAIEPAAQVTPHSPLWRTNAMKQLSADVKHSILLEYQPRSTTHSFAALARRHAVKGGGETVRQWDQRWDGTPRSLKRKAGSGKTRLLSTAQVNRHVRTRILAANRRHEAVHYTTILPAVQQATGTQLSLRSLQRYGKEQLEVKCKRGKKRTANESECTHTGE